MAENRSVQEQHTAAPQAIGFDYQFLYFMYLALNLKHGDIIGFEVKDDVHIEQSDGTVILFQGKHSIQTNVSGEIKNLTALDSDLWKTISNWVDMVQTASDLAEFLKQHSFVLFTNKNEHFNEFVRSLNNYKYDQNSILVIDVLKKLQKGTDDKVIKGYLKNVVGLKVRELKLFLNKLTIETNEDNLIDKIKNRILETARNPAIVEAIFESLYSNMQVAKYLDIKESNKFELTFKDFNMRFNRCFLPAYKGKSLPRREFPILLPEDLETQTFVKQLIDIGELKSGSQEITEYTRQMLKVVNQFAWWGQENLLLPLEIEECDKNAVLIWKNKFRAQYRGIHQQIDAGFAVTDLNEDIQNLAIEIIEYLREQDLTILEEKLGVEL